MKYQFRKEYERVDSRMTQKYLMLIHKIDNEGAITAMDFFTVDKSLLTSVFSTVFTYTIILIQFNLCQSWIGDIMISEPVISHHLYFLHILHLY